MNTVTTDQDQAALRRSAELLESLGRHSRTSAVALHCLTAARLLAEAGIHHDASSEPPRSDRAALDEVLELFGNLSDDLICNENLLDALQHVLLAHIAAR